MIAPLPDQSPPDQSPPETDTGPTAPFGYAEVAAGAKAPLVKAVFDSVAPRYDLMNDLMSAGVHRLWKRALLAQLRPRPGMTIVDVGGGTGDIASALVGRGAGEKCGRVLVCDINQSMLEAGRDRAIDGGRLGGIDWVAADAENLPLADSSVDAYVTAFCLRNVTRLDRALAEARRVLKPGGRFACLEFSHITVPALEKLYDAYSLRVLPWLGGVVAGDADSYRYLAESIRRFPPQEAFAAMIAEAGLARVKYRNLSAGIAAIHSGWRI